MLWRPITLMVLAAAATIAGLRITNGPGLRDERIGGAIYVVVGIARVIPSAVWRAVVVTRGRVQLMPMTGHR